MTATALPRETRAQAVSRRVRGVMGENRISGVRLAKAMGLSQAALSRRTTGELAFSLDELELVAELLDVSEAYLLGFSVTRDPRPVSDEGLGGVRHPRLERGTRWLTPALSGNVFEIDAYRASGTVTSRPGHAALRMVPA